MQVLWVRGRCDFAGSLAAVGRWTALKPGIFMDSLSLRRDELLYRSLAILAEVACLGALLSHHWGGGPDSLVSLRRSPTLAMNSSV